LAEAAIGEKTTKNHPIKTIIKNHLFKVKQPNIIISKINNNNKLKRAGPGKEGKSCEGNPFPLLLCAKILRRPGSPVFI
jgi:hypothetical protein